MNTQDQFLLAGQAFSKRQMKIIELVAQGYSNDAIVEKVEVSKETVGKELTEIFTHLNIDSHGARRKQTRHPRNSRVALTRIYWTINARDRDFISLSSTQRYDFMSNGSIDQKIKSIINVINPLSEFPYTFTKHPGMERFTQKELSHLTMDASIESPGVKKDNIKSTQQLRSNRSVRWLTHFNPPLEKNTTYTIRRSFSAPKSWYCTKTKLKQYWQNVDDLYPDRYTTICREILNQTAFNKFFIRRFCGQRHDLKIILTFPKRASVHNPVVRWYNPADVENEEYSRSLQDFLIINDSPYLVAEPSLSIDSLMLHISSPRSGFYALVWELGY